MSMSDFDVFWVLFGASMRFSYEVWIIPTGNNINIIIFWMLFCERIEDININISISSN